MVAAVAILAGVAALSRGMFVTLPVVENPLPVRSLVAIAAGCLVTIPLRTSFPELVSTLPRESQLRPIRCATVIGLSLATYAVAAARWNAIGWGAGETQPAAGFWTEGGDLRFCLLLITLAVTSIVLIGDYAWLPVLVVGFASTMLATVPNGVFGRTMTGLPLWMCVASMLVAGSAYAVLGAGYPAVRLNMGRQTV